MQKKIINTVEKYYSDKIKKHGANPAGVDWNSKDSQELRFRELCKVIDLQRKFKILDYGCGYGALLGYMQKQFSDFDYTGYDISEDMLKSAKKENSVSDASWTSKLNNDDVFDFVIASGLFNVKQNIEESTWLTYVLKILDKINDLSRHGFAFNILTSYSDKEYVKDYLYYADPCFMFDYCKRHYSKQIALFHDYNLYEFTIVVRK